MVVLESKRLLLWRVPGREGLQSSNQILKMEKYLYIKPYTLTILIIKNTDPGCDRIKHFLNSFLYLFGFLIIHNFRFPPSSRCWEQVFLWPFSQCSLIQFPKSKVKWDAWKGWSPSLNSPILNLVLWVLIGRFGWPMRIKGNYSFGI